MQLTIKVLLAILSLSYVDCDDHCYPDTHFGPPKENQIYTFTDPSNHVLSSEITDSRETCLSYCCNTDNCNIASYNHSASASDDENCFLYSCHPLANCTFQYALDVVSYVLFTDDVIQSQTVPIEIDTTEGPPIDQEIISDKIVDEINDTDIDMDSFNYENITSLKTTSPSVKSPVQPSTKTTNTSSVSVSSASASSSLSSASSSLSSAPSSISSVPSSLSTQTSSSSSPSSSPSQPPVGTFAVEHHKTFSHGQPTLSSTKSIKSTPKDLENNTMATIVKQNPSTSGTSVSQSHSPTQETFSKTPNTTSTVQTASGTKSAVNTSTNQQTVQNTGSTKSDIHEGTKPISQNATISTNNPTIRTTSTKSHSTNASTQTSVNNNVNQTSEIGNNLTSTVAIINKTRTNVTSKQPISSTKTQTKQNQNITTTLGNISSSTTTTTTQQQNTTIAETTKDQQSVQTTTKQETTVSQAKNLNITTLPSLITTNKTSKPPSVPEEFALVKLQNQTASPDTLFTAQIDEEILDVTPSSLSEDSGKPNAFNRTLNETIEIGTPLNYSIHIDQSSPQSHKTAVQETTNEITIKNNTIYFGEVNITFADSSQLLEEESESHVLTAALIATLSFGILFFFAVLVLIGKRCFDSWQKRHYSRIDYLVNGMYN